ncbi:GEVED domain-containing protein [Ferruginibacter sp. HRS2-29]|uniref:GEVED domain-containing protein n=1 Tax=Ferruginibacter sp. HRS2-29 TaxID=2487334 RepID=UPI0020CC3130|nr:GEVED domain-containing protein [Ferruginibacter sp. HRS2-29]MCP9749438.1 T9SS C-terminal target domain-containing protein [Ferruginibacter sp. HRS2-29]
MQSKITLKRFGGFWRKTLTALALLCSVTGTINAQTYVNGNLGSGTVSKNGTTAPTGFQWHELQNNVGNTAVSNTSLAFAYTGTFTVADNFTVPAGQTWTISKMTFYGIQPTAAAVTALNVRIHNSSPLAGATTIVYGNLTTNVLNATTPLNIYGAFNSSVPANNTPGTAYRIFSMDANVATVLTAGTYWVEWKVTAGAATFAPTSVVVGARTQTGYNAIQSNSGAWTALLDGGNPASSPSLAQDLPFSISYTATGVVPCAGTPAPGNTIASVTTTCPGIAYQLSLQTPTTGDGVTYQWQSATTLAGPYTNIIGATAPTLTYSQAVATYYRCQVTCGGNTGTSTPVLVAASTGCYCTPGTVNCSLDDQITNVTLGTLNNNSTCGAGGYTNYTTNPAIVIPDVIKGGANPIRVTVGPGGTEYVGVWIDYNQNGTFETTEFTLLGSGNGSTITGAVNAPAAALSGNTRMRVRVQYNTPVLSTQACAASSSFGEVEDYTVNLVPCVNVALTTQPVNKTVDCGANTTFTVAGTGSLPVFYWEYRVNATSPWQNVPAAAPYTGQNTNTLTITGATSTLNGYQYRAVFSGACTAVDFSSVATLTVNPLVGVVAPANPSVCLGGIQQLSITNTQPATVLTFNSAAALNITIPDNGGTAGVNNVINVSGIPSGVTITSIKIKMGITHSWAGDLVVVAKAPNNNILNLAYALNGTGGASATTGFNPTFSSTLTPTAANLLNAGANPYSGTYAADGYNSTTGDPAVPTGPNGFIPTSTAAARNTFTDLYNSANNANTLNGPWTLALYDYFQDDQTTNKFNNWSIEITYTGGLATGVWTSPAPNSLYTDAAATIPYDGVTSVNTVYAKPTTAGTVNYTVVVNNGICTSAPVTVPLAVNSPATAVSAVANKSVCPLGNTTFTATVTGGSGVTNRWEVSTDGGATYTTVANGGIYSGATTNTLTLTAVPASLNGARYRLVAVAAPCLAGTNITSAAGILTVNPNPVLNLAAAPTTAVFPGITTSVVVAVNPAPSASTTYTWFKNGVQIAGATTNTIAGLDVDDLGTYTVRVTDGNGCTSTSNAVTIVDSATTKLFIYPNPSNGQFHVRYHDLNTSPTFQGPRTLTIYDAKGARVFWKTYSITAPYADMFVDLSNNGKGIYTVDLTDFNGNRIKTGRVLIQ